MHTLRQARARRAARRLFVAARALTDAGERESAVYGPFATRRGARRFAVALRAAVHGRARVVRRHPESWDAATALPVATSWDHPRGPLGAWEERQAQVAAA